MNTYKATISFSYTPECHHILNLVEIEQAASDYLCNYIGDFHGFGDSDKFTIIELYTKRVNALITFSVELATENYETLQVLSDKFQNMGER